MIDPAVATLASIALLSMTGIGVVVGLMMVNHSDKEERDRSD